MSWTLGIIAGIFIILFILAVTTNIFNNNSNKPSMSSEQVKTNTLKMIDNLLQGKATSNITSINYNEQTGMYEMEISINGQEQPTAYASGNGVESEVVPRFIITEIAGLTPEELKELQRKQSLRNAKYA